MNAPAVAGAPAAPLRLGRVPRAAALAAFICAMGLATTAAAVVGNGNLVMTAAPIVGFAILYVLWKVPLRWSAAVLTVLLLSVDNTYDAERKWHSPVAIVGDLLRNNIDWVLRDNRITWTFPGAKLSGLEVILLVLFAITLYRKATRSTIDDRGQVQMATVMGAFVLIYLVSLAYVVANGLAAGGSVDIAILQARPMLHIPLLFFLFHAAFRGPRDHVLIAKIVVLSATIKALMAAWVRLTVEKYIGRLPTLTNHGESILFSAACIVLITGLMERDDRKRVGPSLLFLGIILWGMRANHRRLAWVDLGSALLAIYFVSPWRSWKRSVTRLAIAAAPILVLYVAVGWSSSSSFFAPVNTLRSLSDATVDNSTLYREVENYNLAMSVREAPFLGFGFGKQYTEHMSYGRYLDISRIFNLYRAEPHNAVVGLLVFGGLFAFTGMWALFAVGVFLAARSYRFAQVPQHRAAALCSLAAIIVVCVQFYGDLGQYFIQSRVFAALALAVAGKLAVATGAWPARVRKSERLAAATAAITGLGLERS
jgi:hypothetical protein